MFTVLINYSLLLPLNITTVSSGVETIIASNTEDNIGSISVIFYKQKRKNILHKSSTIVTSEIISVSFDAAVSEAPL